MKQVILKKSEAKSMIGTEGERMTSAQVIVRYPG
jgi:hypothetical protein